MLNRVDRIQLVVPDAASALETFGACFGIHVQGEDEAPALGARRTSFRMGEAEVELLAPAGPGPVRDFLETTGGGLFAGGFSTNDLDAVAASLDSAGATFHRQGDQLFVEPMPVGGLRCVLTAERSVGTEPDPPSLVRHIYEISNLVSDADAAEDFYVRAFGLDRSRFQPIDSEVYGYTGSLTLFDPPRILDRIEICQPHDRTKAMGRFHERRGDSLYMCFAEVDDFDALTERLRSAGAQFALRDPSDHAGDPNVLFIHPRSLHGLLFGLSLTGVAWEWSSGPREGEPAH